MQQGKKLVLASALIILLMGAVSAQTTLDSFEADSIPSNYSGFENDYTTTTSWSRDGFRSAFLSSGKGSHSPILYNDDNLAGVSKPYNVTCWYREKSSSREQGGCGVGNTQYLIHAYKNEPSTGSHQFDIMRQTNASGFDKWTQGNSISGSISTGNDYKIILQVPSNPSSGTWKAWLKDTGGTVQASIKTSSFGVSNPDRHGIMIYSGSMNIDYVQNDVANIPPSIDSTSHSPDPVAKGDSITYTTNASDSDGDNLDAWISVEYWNNGTEFISDKGMSEPSTNDFKISELHNISVVNNGYNATFKVSDGSTNTTGSENFYIEDSGPNQVFNQPSNTTFFDYDISYDIKVQDDGDDVQNETVGCNLVLDNTIIKDLETVQEGGSFTGTFRADLDSHTLEAQCKEQTAERNALDQPVHFSVDNFQIQSNSTGSPVYETENTTYNLDVKVGDMVQSLTANLSWNSTQRTSKVYTGSNSVTTVNQDHYFSPPLVQVNASSYDWSFDYTANYTSFSGNSFSTETKSTTEGNQTVAQAYTDPFAVPEISRGIELEDFETDLNFTKKVTPVKPNVTRFLEYNGTQKTGNKSVFEIPLVPRNSATENLTVTGDLQLSFKNQKLNRSASNQKVAGYKKILTDCNNAVNGVTGTKTKEFEIRNEENKSQKLTGDINYNINVNHHGEHTRNYAFNKTDVKSTQLCIYPAWTSYTGNGPLDYSSDSSQNVNSVNYPQRDIQFLNETLNNNSETRNLYLLESSLAIKTVLKVVDSANNPIEDVRIKNLRYFTGSNSFLTVTSVLTNSDGESATQLKPDTNYKHVLTKNGRVLKETEKEELICNTSPCTKTFQIGESISKYFEFKQGFSYKIQRLKNSNRTTNGLQATVNHDSSTIQNATFLVEKPGVVNRKTVCSITTQSTAQTMVCQFNQTADQQEFFYTLTSWKDNQRFTLTKGSIGASKGFLEGSPWAAAMLFLVVTSFGLVSPRLSIAFSTAGFVATWWIGLITLSIASIASVVLIAGAVILSGGGR